VVLVSKTIEDRADIDPAYQDAEGEPDSQVPNKFPSSPVVKPVGIRQADGTVKPYVSPTSSFAMVSPFAFESTDYQALTSFAGGDRRKPCRKTTSDHPSSIQLMSAEGVKLSRKKFKAMIGRRTHQNLESASTILSRDHLQTVSCSFRISEILHS
jgi:hypothetical protein